MSTQQELFVQHVLDVFAKGDMGIVTTSFHPNLMVHEAASLPFGGQHKGLDAFADMLKSLGATYDIAVTDRDLRSAGDAVILHMDLTVTSRATGRSASLPAIEIYRFTDGLISDIDAFYKDTKAMVDLLDA